MIRFSILFLFTFLYTDANCQQKVGRSSVDRLFTMMQGEYSSKTQSEADSTYFNISLKMIPIWEKKGKFLYVEQAMAGKEDKPYRVRIYKIVKRGRAIVSEIYTLKEEKKWVGKWKTPEAFDLLSTDEIDLKAGCEVVLKKINRTTYSGSTGDRSCASELRGAAYATSVVTITPSRMVSWDRGFNISGTQVWGAEKGGYIFDKLR